jgi:hypothetical protein
LGTYPLVRKCDSYGRILSQIWRIHAQFPSIVV